MEETDLRGFDLSKRILEVKEEELTNLHTRIM